MTTTSKTITEMLDDFYRKLDDEQNIENTKDANAYSIEIIDDNLNSLDYLVNEYEKIVKDKEKDNCSDNSSPNNEIALKEAKKTKIKQILNLAKKDITNAQVLKIVQICLSNKRVIELLQILIEKENDLMIPQLFIRLNPVEIGDYEDCLFIVSDYLTKQIYKLDALFKLLQLSVENGIYTLYPIFSLAVRKLAKASKIQESTILLNYMIYYQIEISTCAINFFIENLCRLELIEDAQAFFNRFLTYKSLYNFPNDIIEKCKFSKLIINSGINIITYGTLIKCLCKSNHMELALYHYENLKEQNMIKDEIIFNLLIDGCSKTSNLDQLKHIYYDMLNLKITPTIVTFNTIIDAYIRAKDINSAWQIYEDILSKGVRPDNFTYSTIFRGIRHKSHKDFLRKSFIIVENLGEEIDIILINVLLDSCISMREDKLIVELFEKVKSSFFKKIKPDIITYNTFIKGCAQMNLFAKASEAFEYMFSQSDVILNDVTFNTMIDVCVRSNNMPLVWSIIEKMKKVGIKPDNFTYSTIIKGLNKNTNLNVSEESESEKEKNVSTDSTSELELAFRLFENVKKFSKPDEILYNCIMDACLRFDRIDKMLELYDQMLVENIKPSSITCGIIIKAYGMKGNVEKALEIYEEMKSEKIEISSITYGCLINACIRNDNMQKAFELYEELGNNKIEMNIVLYTTLIKAYSKNKELSKVLEIFNKMKRDKNNSPNNVTYNSVIDCCIKCEEIKLAEKILEEMYNSSIKPDIITFSTLIKGCLKKFELNKAIDYLNTMQKFEIKPDEVLLNSLLDGCEKMKKYNKAVEIFEYVRGFGVEPSMMSYSIMMKILGKINDFKNSKILIEEVKKKNKNISLIIFTCYMKTCFSTGNVEEAINIYNQLKLYRLNPDSITFSTILSGLLAYPQADSIIILNIIKESLSMNIMISEKFYFEAIKRFNSHDKLSEEVSGLLKTLEEMNINVDLNGKSNFNYNKGDGNLNYLINSYKHKKFTSYTNTSSNKYRNSKTFQNSNKKEKAKLSDVNNEDKIIIPDQKNSDSQNFKNYYNVNTGSNFNYNNKNINFNYNSFDNPYTVLGNNYQNSKKDDTEGRSKFIKSKKEVGIVGEITKNKNNSYNLYHPYNPSSTKNLAATDKENGAVKNKKFNRF